MKIIYNGYNRLSTLLNYKNTRIFTVDSTHAPIMNINEPRYWVIENKPQQSGSLLKNPFNIFFLVNIIWIYNFTECLIDTR
jgi:hypothetical protein